MKHKLLLFFTAFLISNSVSSQAYANMPPNLSQCNNEIFNLTVLSPIILGGQNPNDFTVSYFLSLADATANVNPLINPTIFVANNMQIVYARVSEVQGDSFAVTSFTVQWTSSWIPDLPDVTVCDSYILPPLQAGQYYTGPGGSGTMLLPSHVITTSMTLYIYSGDANCVQESSFTIIVTPTPIPDFLANVYSCTPYTLPPLINSNYYTGPNQTGALIPTGTVITSDTNLYIFAGFGFCTAENMFRVDIGNPTINALSPIVACSATGFADFNLQLKVGEVLVSDPTATVTFHETMTDAENGILPLSVLSFTNTISNSQVIYVRLQRAIGGCFSVAPLELVVVPCTQNSITGNIRADVNNNGCDVADPAAANIQVSSTNGNIVSYAFTDAAGNYEFTNVQQGNNIIEIQSGLPTNLGIATPANYTVAVTSNADEYVANDFCLSGPQNNDAIVYLTSNVPARPGFPITYYLYVYNNGNTVLNGSAVFGYDASKLAFVGTNPPFSGQTQNSFTFNFNNLEPFHSQQFAIDFMVLQPPVVDLGTVIYLTANVLIDNDVNPTNNAVGWSQVAVNSFDPNDISVKEGNAISPEQADEYLHYTIRFQNMGNADAVNVRITNNLDSNLDWSTFRPIAASHNYQAELANGQASFRFKNINLPGSLENEVESHGYVMYKIKPRTGLVVGDAMSNQAQIFFDFNAPITTNMVTTQIVVLGAPDVALHNLKMYPNPATEFVILESEDVLKLEVAIVDLQGKVILQKKDLGSRMDLDVSQLETGIYFAKINADGKLVTKTLIVK